MEAGVSPVRLHGMPWRSSVRMEWLCTVLCVVSAVVMTGLTDTACGVTDWWGRGLCLKVHGVGGVVLV